MAALDVILGSSMDLLTLENMLKCLGVVVKGGKGLSKQHNKSKSPGKGHECTDPGREFEVERHY